MANLISNISNVGFKTSEGGEIFNDYKGNIASGVYSHAEGRGTKASSNYQHVQGQHNIEDSSNTYADIIGNGSSDNERSNASTVDWEGNAWYSGDVYVGSTSGTNKDEGSKKLATEEYTNNIINKKIEVSETAPTEEENKIWLQPMITNVGAVDYIVEQGISGIWTYRKWNSGKIELWTNNIPFTINWEQLGPLYFSSKNSISVPMVTDIECVNGDSTYWHYANWSSVTKSSSEERAIDIRYYSINDNGNGDTINFSAYIIGRWK